MEYAVDGTVLQTVTCKLSAGETLYTQSGGMAWMTGEVEMKTSSGGLLAGLKRSMSGSSFFITDYSCRSGSASITFSAEVPGKIIPLQLRHGEEMIVQKDGFLAAEKSVQLDIFFQRKLGAGFFGGEGFILQKLQGPGVAFVQLSGEIVEAQLSPGQLMRVDTGHVGMFEPSTAFDVEMVKGVRNIFFGGEGLFFATLRGPGRVWLQTMPISKLAARINSYLPSKG